MCGVEPGDASSPTEAGDRNLAAVASLFLLGELESRIEIAHHLLVGNLRHHFADDVLNIRHARWITLPHEEVRGDGQIAEAREAAADIFDVLMHAEDLFDYQNS